MPQPKITTCLWFDSRAEEAAKFYVSLFPNSKIERVSHYPEGAPAPAGSVMTVEFNLAGHQFIALNGGPYFKLTEAVSVSVACESQAEIDRLWEKLTADGGQESQCGWLKDKYGLSWQIFPSFMPHLMCDPDPAKGKRVMQAMMGMVKLDIAALQRAADGK